MVAQLPDKSATEAFYQRLANLHAREGEGWVPLPQWAQFYLELGTIAGLRPLDNGRLIMALAVPSRAYVAALIAAGCVLARAVLHHDPSATRAQHIARMQQWKPGKPVVVREEKRRLKGIYQGILRSNGNLYFKVQTDSRHGTVRHYPEDRAHQIEPLEVEQYTLPEQQKGRTRQETVSLVAALLANTVDAFTIQSCYDCFVIGQVSAIKEELESAHLGILTGKREYKEGMLLDILRPKRLLASGTAYRSQVLPSRNERTDTLAQAKAPHMVIFDGSLSYLNRRQAARGNHAVIVLDQTEPQFEAASEQVNQEYYRRLNREPGVNLPVVPAGVEVMLYEVRVS